MAERQPRGDDENCDGPDKELKSGPSQGGRHWYSWSRWKYIGGGLFLLLSVAGVGYVVWDIIDLLPKPIAMGMVREALRESPGRITDMVALAGLISFGPPAGVDLMFGATEAARQWARERQKKERAKGRAEGRAEGRVEEREKMRELLRQISENNPDVQRLLDELEDDQD
ncbi:MAG: hypothetical protein F4X64_05495 [Chloroflexi bacterium]|nr:hypothetical protein [Chloroflexota bacterium]